MPQTKTLVSIDRAVRRGPVPLAATDKRGHCVSVRLNPSELAQLDARRGRFQRGEWIRMAAIDQLAPTVPSVNVQAWAELAKLADRLDQVQSMINQSDVDFHQTDLLNDLYKAIMGLRFQLLGIEVQS